MVSYLYIDSSCYDKIIGIGIVTITKYLLYTPTIQATPSQTSSDEYRWCTAVEIPNMFHIYFILLIFCVCRNVKLVNASVKEMAADGRKRKAKVIIMSEYY